MKNNKYIFLVIIFLVIISRNSLVNLINNTLKSFFIKDNNILRNILNNIFIECSKYIKYKS